MPPRKKSTTQNERRRKVSRTDNNDEDTLVISDSENEEEEEEVINVTPRATRWMKREKKAQMQDMTEDEMLDLAMRLSKQEASSATQREQLEDADMRKAIAESLNVNHGQGSETRTQDRPSSLVKPHEESDTVSVHLKRKLSFPNVGSRHGESGDDTTAAVSNVERKQQVSPLPPMPDLSQKSSSQPSPPSPVLPSVPSTASRESQSSHQKDLGEQGLHADSPEDEPSQSTSQLQTSPAFRRCSLRLNQDSPSTSKASRTLPRTYDCSVRLTCSGKSQFTQLQSPSPPQSPIFAETDPKGMSEAKFSHCTSCGSFKKDVCTPDETFQGASSHKSSAHECRDPQNRVSLSGKAQPSSSVSVPEDAGLKQEPVKPTEKKDEAQETAKGSTQRSESTLPADTKSLDEYTSHMVLHMSDDDDDEEEEEEEKVFAPSPVFAQECVSPAGQRKLSPTQPCCSPLMNISTTHTPSHTKTDSVQERPDMFRMPGVPEAATSDSRLGDPLKERGEGLLSYYWGVPFCPKGQSPDEYTRVILTQLEVYEKSLKDAQRQLLHKAEWGLPVGPCPIERPFGKRLKRHRAPQLQEEEEEDEERGQEEKEGGRKVEEMEESQPCTEEGAENGQSETYVVVSSPEPQEELLQKSPLLLGQREAVDSAKPSSCRKPIAQDLPEDLEVQQPAEQKEEVQNGSFDLGSTVCPETQMTEDDTPELMVTAQQQAWEETEVMEVDEAGEPPAEAEEKMEQEPSEQEEQWMEAGPPQSQSEMECPICSHLFPLSKIELHAAYCNGTVEEQPPQENVSQGTAPRTRTKKVVMEEALSEKSVQREKCYLCCKLIPGKEYPKHVEQCFQKTTKGANQGNGLLSALNQTEQVHLDDDRPGPSDVVTKNSRGLADPALMAETGESTDSQELTYRVSTSPIKSFTPISEVTDCLIDFSKQYSNRANQRLGRKRKFKR